jgi:hypothetical protein
MLRLRSLACHQKTNKRVIPWKKIITGYPPSGISPESGRFGIDIFKLKHSVADIVVGFSTHFRSGLGIG